MGNEINKEHLEAFTEATIKSATALEKIVSTLELIIEKQDKMLDRIFNGMIDEIIGGVTTNYNVSHKETVDCLKRLEQCSIHMKENFPDNLEQKLRTSSWAEDIKYTKWFVAVVGIVVIIATVILNALDNRAVLRNEIDYFKRASAIIEQNTKYLSHDETK